MDDDFGIVQIIPDGDMIRLVATGKTGLAGSLAACLTHFKIIGEWRELRPEFHGDLSIDRQNEITLIASRMHREDVQCGEYFPGRW